MKTFFGTNIVAALALLSAHPAMAVTKKGAIQHNDAKTCWSVASDQKIEMAMCNPKDPKQLFFYDAAGEKTILHFVSPGIGNCVDGTPNLGQIGLKGCTRANSMKWTFNSPGNDHVHTADSQCAKRAFPSIVDVVGCVGSAKGGNPEEEFFFVEAPIIKQDDNDDYYDDDDAKNEELPQTAALTSAPTAASTTAPIKTPTKPPAPVKGLTGVGPRAPAKPLTGAGTGDPHFKTWLGDKYDFHGGCDLVLLKNRAFASGMGLTIHIRTKIETWWSYIEAAVVQIGDHLLEIMGGPDGDGPHVWINGSPSPDLDVDNDPNLKTLEAELGSLLKGFKVHYTHVSSKQHKIRIDLNAKGDAISLETYKDWVSVNVKAVDEQNFLGTKGLMGEYPSGSKVGRDGTTVFTDTDAFGQEWQVLSTEPMLFHEAGGVQHPEMCAMPTLDASAGRKNRRLGEALITEEAAALACAHADEDSKNGCIYDVLATNDKDIAGAY